MKKIKIFLPIIFLLLVIIVPIFVNAQEPTQIVSTKCGVTLPGGGVNRECGYADLIELVNTIITWIIMISVPVAAGVFAWAGIKYMITGVSDQKSAAKAMMMKVLIGFTAILAAWIIVTTITNTLLSPDFKTAVPIDGANK